jgi:periplasmic protein TonB
MRTSILGTLVSIALAAVAPAFAQTDGSIPPPPVAEGSPSQPEVEFLANVIWLEQPDGEVFARFYPQPAIDREAEGRVTLDCLVGADGRLTCTVVSEDPPGLGFAYATLGVARHFRAAPLTRDGVSTAGGRVRRTIRWVIVG